MVEVKARESSSGEVGPGSGGPFAEALAAIGEAEATLRQAGIATDWIAEGLHILLRRAPDLATAGDLAELQALAGRAAELSRKMPEVRARIAAGEQSVAAARQEMGAALGVSPRRLLREPGADPSERLIGAASQVDDARAWLGAGNVADATVALEQAGWLAAEAAAIVAAARRWNGKLEP